LVVVTTIEKPMIIKGGAEVVILSYIFPLPIEFEEIHVVVDNTQVEELEELVIPN
jgi:hypothetical protein